MLKQILIQITIYCGCLIGSGFATGKEIQVYFVSGNEYYLYSIILATIFFLILFFIESFNQKYCYVCNSNVQDNRAEIAISSAIKLIYLLCMLSVFFAGISTLVSNCFSISYVVAVGIVMIVFVLFALLDVRWAVNLNFYITIAIIVLILTITMAFINSNNIHFSDCLNNQVKNVQIIKGIIYVAYNIILPLSFSKAVTSGKKKNTQNIGLVKKLFLIILPACAIIGSLLTLVAICTSSAITSTTLSAMPLVTIASRFGKLLSGVYIFLLLGTMFVSAITTYYSFIAESATFCANNLHEKVKFKLFVVILCSLLSCVGFTSFIERIYPLLAVFGIIVIIISVKRFISILLILKSKNGII